MSGIVDVEEIRCASGELHAKILTDRKSGKHLLEVACQKCRRALLRVHRQLGKSDLLVLHYIDISTDTIARTRTIYKPVHGSRELNRGGTVIRDEYRLDAIDIWNRDASRS